MKLIPGSDEQLVVGVVTPCEWDIGNKITAVAIVTEAEEEFLLSSSVSVVQLLPHLEKPVEAVGAVSSSADGVNMFSMRAYRSLPDDYLIDPEESEWEELECDDGQDKRRQRRNAEDVPRQGRMSKATKHKNKKIKEKDGMQ